jgi:hypothetical protein
LFGLHRELLFFAEQAHRLSTVLTSLHITNVNVREVNTTSDFPNSRLIRVVSGKLPGPVSISREAFKHVWATSQLSSQ